MLIARILNYVIVALVFQSPADARQAKPTESSPQAITIRQVLSFDEDQPLRIAPSDSELDNYSTADSKARAPHYDFVGTYRRLKDQLTNHHDESGRKGRQDNAKGAKSSLSPVILVPGYGGSRLEGKRNKSNTEHYFCEKLTDWANIWIDLKLMLPYMIDCLIEDFRLDFDYQANTTLNSPGIDIRVCDPNDVTNVEYLTDIHLTSFGYFAPIIRKLVKSLGYKRNHNIKGAPYDFRKAPNELPEFFAKLKRDSEQLYEKFGHRLTYICHSMGCNNILYFLQHQSKEWKDQHVLRVISLAAPWGGSMQAVRATVFGDNLGLPYLFDETKLRIVQKSVPSTMYLYPKEPAFKDSPLISFKGNESKLTTQGNRETLTATDFKRFFEKIDHPSGYLMWLNTKDLLGSLEAPQVEVWCLYGKDHPTLGRMEFQGDFPESREEDVFDDGDGTVSVQSSTFCKEWSNEQSSPVHLVPFSLGHVDILRDSEVLDKIETIIRGDGK